MRFLRGAVQTNTPTPFLKPIGEEEALRQTFFDSRHTPALGTAPAHGTTFGKTVSPDGITADCTSTLLAKSSKSLAPRHSTQQPVVQPTAESHGFRNTTEPSTDIGLPATCSPLPFDCLGEELICNRTASTWKSGPAQWHLALVFFRISKTQIDGLLSRHLRPISSAHALRLVAHQHIAITPLAGSTSAAVSASGCHVVTGRCLLRLCPSLRVTYRTTPGFS